MKNIEDLFLLVIDDSEIDLKNYKRLIKALGVKKCLYIRNGYEALKMISTLLDHEYPPDLIITDWMMEKLSGLDLFKLLKKSERASSIPVLMITSKSSKDDIVAAYKFGLRHYMVKPVSIKSLDAKLKEVFEIV